jgi:hypothetical protein
VEELEPLIVPANPQNYLWVGAAGANWSVNTNWTPVGIPGSAAGDTVTFDGTTDNNNSTMNLGGVAFAHIGKLVINAAYTGTITLNNDLVTDVLEMAGGKITSAMGTNKDLEITQRTTPPAPATVFASSTWTGGQISSPLVLDGELAHQATLLVTPQVNVLLNGNFTIADSNSTVKWTSGNFRVFSLLANARAVVDNSGTFLADSPGGIMGDRLGGWTFINRNILNLGKGEIQGTKPQNVGNGRTFKVASAGGTGGGTFVVDAGFLQQDSATTEIQSGILSRRTKVL